MATVKDTILAQTSKAFDAGKGIFADSLLDALNGVNAQQAGWVPEGTEHAIGALVNHITYWKNFGIAAYNKDQVPDGPSADWQVVSDEASWRQAQDQLAASHATLLGILEKLSEDDMDNKPEADGWPSWKEVFLGFVAHDVYHTAQIVKLRELQGIATS